ncbi:hypothetical protein A2U01_0089044, partial [Trifolium medium]|nr:hypothetical protein [Trifolium medium]
LKETIPESNDVPDVGASFIQPNSHAAIITEPFDDSSKSETASEEEEVQGNQEIDTDVVEVSQVGESKKNVVA